MIPFLKKNKDGKKPPKSTVPRTAQESIPFQRMFEDGTCRVRPGYYTRTIQYQDINYQLEDKLVNKIFKGLIRFLIEVIVMTVLIVGINIFTNGMYLWGLPRINDIQSVNITYPSVTDDVKEISSSEDIELALKLTGFLKYDLFGEVNSEEEPAITITYFLKDGTSKTISANNTTVWWNNKIHVIKDKEMFVNLTEGIFFLEDLQTK